MQMAFSGKAVKRMMPKGSQMLDRSFVFRLLIRSHVYQGRQAERCRIGRSR